MKRRNRRRRLSRPANETIHASIETTENRCLLAGVIGMEITNGGDVILTGDAAANDIEIGLVSEDEGYVLGVNGTQVELDGMVLDGHTFPLVPTMFHNDVPAIEGDLVINMGNGSDSVTFLSSEIDGTLLGVSVAGDMSVDLGTGGDDFVYHGGETFPIAGFEIATTGVLGDIDIKGGSGSGSDYIEVSQLITGGEVRVLTGASGAGLDQVAINESYMPVGAEFRGGSGETEIAVQGSIFDNLLIKGGSGDDQLFVSSSGIDGDLTIDTGSASNGMLGDYVGIGSTIVGEDLKIDGRQGTTTVQFQATQPASETEIIGTTTINLRGGSDSILIDDLEPTEFQGNVTLKTGGGSDVVEIQGDTFFDADLTVNLGGGADTVEFANAGVAVQGDGVLNGGGGVDTAINHPFAIWFSGDPLLNSIEHLIA